jgi:hypothetical protein
MDINTARHARSLRVAPRRFAVGLSPKCLTPSSVAGYFPLCRMAETAIGVLPLKTIPLPKSPKVFFFFSYLAN